MKKKKDKVTDNLLINLSVFEIKKEIKKEVLDKGEMRQRDQSNTQGS